MNFCGRSWADEKVKLKQIMVAWQNRRNMAHTIKCRIKGNVLIPKGIHNAETPDPKADKRDIPIKDYEHPENLYLAIDFANNRVRKETETEIFDISSAVFKPYRGISIFDGSRIISSSDGDANAIDAYIVSPGQYKGGFFGTREYPVLFGLGIVDCDMTDPHDLRKTSSEGDFLVISQAVLKQHDCIVLRRVKPSDSRIKDEFWVDMNRDGAILRWQRFWGANLSLSLDIDYQQNSHGWVPRSWTGSEFSFVAKPKQGQNQLQSTSHMIMSEFIVNLDTSPQEMQFKLKPGMTVDKTTDDGSFHLYSVQSDGRLVPFGEHNSHGLIIFTIILFVCAILVSLYLIKRSRKKASQ